jgi:repressor LexA
VKSGVKLKDKQQMILDCIKDKIRSDGYPPSIREIGEMVGLKSSSSVHAHLVQLEKKGLLKRDPAKPRTIIPVENDAKIISQTATLPVIGNVAAGSPILAEQNIENYLAVPLEFIGQGTHYILKVKGDSMIEAGILDGDFLIVRQQADAANGEIIVAIINNEATVKRFYRRDGYIELRPENCTLKPIIVDKMQIAGKVTGLLRHM